MPYPEPYSGETDAARPSREPQISERSRGVALALGFLGGFFGLHRFYVGKTGTGLGMICTLGGLGFWWLYDIILLATGEFRDAEDLPLRRWVPDEPMHGGGARAERRVEEIEVRLEALQREFNDLAERVDFAERMLAQQRERPQLPRA
jgi:TM2 domain-containing membrane protein YozV